MKAIVDRLGAKPVLLALGLEVLKQACVESVKNHIPKEGRYPLVEVDLVACRCSWSAIGQMPTFKLLK
jgi:hypothetical protein